MGGLPRSDKRGETFIKTLLSIIPMAKLSCGTVQRIGAEDNPLYVVSDSSGNERTYRRLEQLGEGGSGLVYRVLNGKEDGLCMKEFRFGMRKGDADAFKARDLFIREAGTLKGLNHPQIPRYVDFFVDDRNGEEKLYIVMEYVHGKTLTELAKEKRFTQDDALQLAKQVCNVLTYTHSFTPPIVHRDIKPENLSRTEEGTIKLLDFGSVTDAVLRGTKATWTTVGTLGFTAPEVALYGKPVPATDIYSLGATMLWLLSGGGDIVELFMNDDYRLDFRGKLNVDSRVEQLLWDMTEPNVNKRIQNTEEMRIRLYSETFAVGEEMGVSTAGTSKNAVSRSNKKSAISFKEIECKVHANWFRCYSLDEIVRIDLKLQDEISHVMDGYGEVTFDDPTTEINHRGMEAIILSLSDVYEFIPKVSAQRRGINHVRRHFQTQDMSGEIWFHNNGAPGWTFVKIERDSFEISGDLETYSDIATRLLKIKV